MSHTSAQAGACVDQHQFSYARRMSCVASMSASSRRSATMSSRSVEILSAGESVEPTYSIQLFSE